MVKDKIKKQKSEMWMAVAMIVATVISMLLRLFYGWDQDESYVVLLATKIAQGCPLFKELWDLHQTSAIFTAIFAKPYLVITKTTDGIGIYLRLVSLVLQFMTAVYTYVIVNKHYGKMSAILTATLVANMLPRATQQFEYGTMTVWAAIICSLVLLDLYYEQKNAVMKLVFAGFFYSISVLSYPTMVISLPAYILFMALVLKCSKNDKIKFIVSFMLVCIMLAFCFVGFVLKNMSMYEFVNSLKAISNSGDHGSFFSSVANPDFWIKPMIRVIITIGIALVLSHIVHNVLKIDVNPFFVYILLTTFVVIMLNVTGIRPSGPYGFLERFIGTVIMFLFIRQDTDKSIIFLFVLSGVLMYVGALMGSNLGLNENAMFLEVALIGCTIGGAENIHSTFVDNEKFSKERYILVFERIAITIFALGTAFASGYFVRVNYTAPANFTQCNSMFVDGPLKGISVTESQMNDMSRRALAIDSQSNSEEIYAILSNEPVYNYYIKGVTSAPRYVTTAKYNSQWISYYEEFEHTLPDVLFVDTYWFPQIDMFYNLEFGDWVKDRYHLEKTEYDDVFWKLVKN